MIEEIVKVLDIHAEYLWVEGVQRSACQSCVAQQGCGQRILARYTAHPVRLRVALDGRSAAAFHVGQNVTIGIEDHAVVRGSLLIYLLPLLLLLLGVGLGDILFANDLAAISCGLLALFSGGLFSGRLLNSPACESMLQAQLLDV